MQKPKEHNCKLSYKTHWLQPIFIPWNSRNIMVKSVSFFLEERFWGHPVCMHACMHRGMDRSKKQCCCCCPSYRLHNNIIKINLTGPPMNIWFLRHTWAYTLNGIPISSAVLAQLTVVTNKHTHTYHTTSVTIGHIYAAHKLRAIVV